MMCDRRLVMYAGPAKTASTSLQDFFALYASNDALETKLSAFQGWNMPMENQFLARFLGMGRPDWPRTRGNGSFRDKSDNLLLVSEMVPALMYRGEGPRRLAEIFRIFDVDPKCAEFGLHYRTPRVDHLLSYWKQVASKDRKELAKGATFEEFSCASVDLLNRGLHILLNTLEIISDMRSLHRFNDTDSPSDEFDWPITIVDMSGVESNGQDIVQTWACDILGVPCVREQSTGMMVIQGLEKLPKRSNVRPRDDSVVSPEQRAELEKLFRDRDCLFRDKMQKDTKIRVLHQKTLWQDCPKESSPISHLADPKYFTARYKQILKCPNADDAPILQMFPSKKQNHDLDLDPDVIATTFLSSFTLLSALIFAAHFVRRRQWVPKPDFLSK